MTIITNTTNVTTLSAAEVYPSVDEVMSVIKQEIDNSDIYQFMTWLLTHDPEFKRKFIAFQTAKRMGVVK